MKYLILFLFFIQLLIGESIGSPYCGFPSPSNNTNKEENVVIQRCTDFYEHPEWEPCTVVYDGIMKKGDYYTDDSDENDNTFVYMGDGQICYSVYTDFGGCNFIDGSEGCINYCVSDYYTTISYNTIKDYYSCTTVVSGSYVIKIGTAHEESPSNSAKLFCHFILVIISIIISILM